MGFFLFLVFALGIAAAAYCDFALLGVRSWRAAQYRFWLLAAIVILQILYMAENDPNGLSGVFYLLMFLTGPALLLLGLEHIPKTLWRAARERRSSR
jgi:hypothetical protein